jgi:hypothetical protein
MRNSRCKILRHRTKQLLTEWYHTLLEKDQSDHINVDNILTYLPEKTLINNHHKERMECSVFSYRWTYGKVRKNPAVTVEELKVFAYGPER